ncbi:tRNA pseudouridine synthase Pus10 isoform X2 [Rhodamnia argentea]|uniref:tRNA pseudouridine(55) synthase n=1 Tax=Rhodamnia argentea TaxID=178133 RepID=A0ABM3H1S7_9MYRT|nr:tRNA pseudouridine synthase Pus10 isoform X2 [Rhodamnia argentea]
MADEAAADSLLDVERQEAALASDGDADLQAFREAVHSLPSDAVKDLMSAWVCSRCIFRLFGLTEPCSCPCLSPSVFTERLMPENLVGSLIDGGSSESEHSTSLPEPVVCSVCLGILQFYHNNDVQLLVSKDGMNDLAASIAELVKQEGHQTDSFSLEVSIPSITLDNERVIMSYMSRKYGSQLYSQERSFSECICLKNALKSLIKAPLETLLGVKYGQGPLHIRLTYSESSKTIEKSVEHKFGATSKRRKKGNENGLETVDGLMNSGIGCIATGVGHSVVTDTPVNGLQHHQSSDFSKLLLEKVRRPCSLSFHCNRDPIYFGGRYLKYSRNVSQTCWMIDEDRMGEASVEEIISSCILLMCRGDKYKFHAAGREDMDVRMLGSGRPFLVEIQNPRHVPSDVLVKDIEHKINSSREKLVRVKNLKLVGSQGWTLMREGEAEKQKQYAALVWISRPLEDPDLLSISSVRDMCILQRTPIRVLHRRSPLDREKIIHWLVFFFFQLRVIIERIKTCL